MKTTFHSNCLLSAVHLRAAALDKLVKPQRELCELMDAFAILDIWQSLFHSSHGQLQSLVHCSNPDDPPDVIAQFARGDLGIEHTIIEPSHRVHGTKLIQHQFPGLVPLWFKLELPQRPRRRGEQQTTSGHRQSCQCRHEVEKLGAHHK